MRARLPLDPNAVRAADESIAAKTSPPGRRLDPTDPADRKLRQEWMKAYERAGGDVEHVKRPKATPAPPRPEGSALKRCPRDNFIELCYLDYTNRPVGGAGFEITSPIYSASGVLNAQGWARIDGVPDIGGFEYEFFADPRTYAPSPPKVPTVGVPQAEAAGMLRRMGRWLWGTVEGDWNEDPDFGQIGVNLGLGLIPLVDQALDLRDLTANIWWLIDWYMKTPAEQAIHPPFLGLDRETWLWLNTFLCALGCIPELGSALKGVLKGLLKELGDTFKQFGGISPERARHIWERLISYANHVGIDPGNAARWLKELPPKMGHYLTEAEAYIDKGFKSVESIINRAEAWARRIPGGVAGRVLDRARRARKALGDARAAMARAKKRVNDWLQEMFARVLPGENRFRKSGDINVTTKDGANTRVQDEVPPPDNPPVEPPHVSSNHGVFGEGTLTEAELAELQAIADKYNTSMEVVGSRAQGTGRNIGEPELPVGKGEGTRSDIDVRIDGQPDIDSGGRLSHDIANASNEAGKAMIAPRMGLAKPPYIKITPHAPAEHIK